MRGDVTMMTDVKVRFTSYVDIVNLMHVGDVDRPAGAGPLRGAVITAVGGTRPIDGKLSTNTGFVVGDGAQIYLSAEVGQPLSVREADVRVPLDRSQNGWRYRGLQIKAGGGFLIETPSYAVRGVIMTMSPPAATRAVRESP